MNQKIGLIVSCLLALAPIINIIAETLFRIIGQYLWENTEYPEFYIKIFKPLKRLSMESKYVITGAIVVYTVLFLLIVVITI